MAERQSFKFSVLDFTVALVILFLVLFIAAFSYFGHSALAGARIAYLYPASGAVPNIWIASLDQPADARQLSFSTLGIYDFDVSPDGSQIIYSTADEERQLRDLYNLNLQTGSSQQISFCAADLAECYTPVYHPDGASIAFLRSSFDSSTGTFGAPRIWLMNLIDGTVRPLTSVSQIIGHSPQWSPDGSKLAFYSADFASRGILVYPYDPDISLDSGFSFLPSSSGTVGAFSPEGDSLIFPDLVNRADGTYNYLRLVDFSQDSPSVQDFTNPDEAIDDIALQWYPDGTRATILRRYTDERQTRGYQLYDINVATGELSSLLVDEHYAHFSFSWDKHGENLLMQRMQLLQADGSTNPQARSEIWVLNTETENLTKIVDSAYFPLWVETQ